MACLANVFVYCVPVAQLDAGNRDTTGSIFLRSIKLLLCARDFIDARDPKGSKKKAVFSSLVKLPVW